MANFLDDLKDDPRMTGVDFTKDVFMYYIDEGSDEKFICVSLDISDEEKFEEFGTKTKFNIFHWTKTKK